jgi:hypothetical protein
MIRLAPLLLLATAGCSTANLDCTDLRQGACKVHFTRFATDVGASLSGPQGFTMTYTSEPNSLATAEAFAAINRLAGLVGRVPAVPTPSTGDGEADGVGWTVEMPLTAWPDTNNYANQQNPKIAAKSQRSCPAGLKPRRVTAGTPWMVEGLAMAA